MATTTLDRALTSTVVPHVPVEPPAPLAVAIRHSANVWVADLRELLQHAGDRFGDVSWEVGSSDGLLHDDDDEDDGDDGGSRRDGHGGPSSGRPLGPTEGETIWGHKAMIYARAPPTFQVRYFPQIQPRSASPSHSGSLRPPSSASFSAVTLAMPSLSQGNEGPLNSWTQRSLRPSASHISLGSTLTAASTIRPPLRLRVEATPQMFRAELEWLYAGEGMGEVVEWLNDRETRLGEVSGLGSYGIGTEGEWGKMEGPNGDAKGETLRNDLVFMWRASLYADVKLVLPLSSSSGPQARAPAASSSITLPLDHKDSATFSTHRFILVSRSPYFATLLLNTHGFDGGYRDRNEIELPMPPFTPASLHFCLGYMYAGTLAFSNRTYDLQTAFEIHRSATYLQMNALRSEVESRIVHEMCDSLSLSARPSKASCRRVPRVWRFAAAPDVGARELEQQARAWMLKHWGDVWGREVGELGKRERDALLKDLLATTRSDTVISFIRGIEAVRARTESDVRTAQPRGLRQNAWIDNLLGMMMEVEHKAKTILAVHLKEIVESPEFTGLLEGKGFERDLLVKLLEHVVAVVGTPEVCKEAGRVYQTLVSSLILRLDSDTLEPSLASGSENRRLVETARSDVIKHIRRRWMQIRDKGGFTGLEMWALKEIGNEIDQPDSELLAPPLGLPASRPAPRLSSSSSAAHFQSSDDSSAMRPVANTRHTAVNGGSVLRRDSDAASVSSRRSSTSTVTTVSTRTVAPRSSLGSTETVLPAGRTSSTASATSRATVARSSCQGASSQARSTAGLKAVRTAAAAGPMAATSQARTPSSTAIMGPPSVPAATKSERVRSAGQHSLPRLPSTTSVRSTASSSSFVIEKRLVAAPTLPPTPGAQPVKPAPSSSSRSRTLSAASATSVRSTATTVRSATASATSPHSSPSKSVRRPHAAPSSRMRSTLTSEASPSNPSVRTTTLLPKISSSDLKNLSSPDLKKAATELPKAPRRATSAAAIRPVAPTATATATVIAPLSLLSTTVKRPYPPAFITAAPLPVVNTVLSPQLASTSLGNPEPSSALTSTATSSVKAERLKPLTLSPPSSPTTASTRPSRLHPASAFDPPKRRPLREIPAPKEFVICEVGSSVPILPCPGIHLNVGIPCIVALAGTTKRTRCRASARYIGRLRGEKGYWVGVEVADASVSPENGPLLDAKESQGGDGCFEGVRYFDISLEQQLWAGDDPRRRKRQGRQRSTPGGMVSDDEMDIMPPASSPTSTSTSTSGGGTSVRGVFLRPTDVVWVEGAE